MQAVIGHLHEVGVGALRLEGIVPTQFRAVLFHIDFLDIPHKLHEMTGSGVQEISAHHRLNTLYVNHFQLHDPFRVGRVLGRGDNLRHVRTVGGQEVPDAVGGGGFEAQHIGKGRDASATVAAHHAAAAVGVEEFHGKVVGRFLGFARNDSGSGPQDHEAVGAVFLAQRGDGFGAAEVIYPALAPVQHHKVVSCSGELIYGHGVTV